MVDRRAVLTLGIAATLPARGQDAPLLTRTIPSSGERLPAIGLGTWLAFHIPITDSAAMARRKAVLDRFLAGGGALIDSSPM